MTIYGIHFNDAWLLWLYFGGCGVVILAVVAVVSRIVDALGGK